MKTERTLFKILLGIVVASIVSVSAVSVAFADTPQQLFDDNTSVVAAIDPNGYFAEVKAKAEQDARFTAVMEHIVLVAKAYDGFAKAYAEEDYSAKDWQTVEKQLGITGKSVGLNAENIPLDNIARKDDPAEYYAKYEKYLKTIADDKASLDASITALSVSYEAERQAASAAVLDRRNTLLQKNDLGLGSPEKTVGYYDAKGKKEVEDTKKAFDTELATYELDKTDYDGSVNKIKTLKNDKIAEMDAVRVNDVERAYDKLCDYYDTLRAKGAAAAQSEKQEVTRAINALTNFWRNASPEINKKYATEKKAFDDFFDENDIDDSEYIDRNTIETEDGVIVIEAFVEKNGDLEEAPVFPAAGKLKAYDVAPTSAKRHNAEVDIMKENSKISVAYFIDIEVYCNSGLWKPMTELDGKQIIYKVSIDLARYYENYIKGHDTFIGGLLKKTGIKKLKSDDKTESIIKSADEIEKGSLGYCYYRADGDTLAKAVKTTLDDGVLTVETNSFNSIAITENEKQFILYNPWVYIIAFCAIVVLIILIRLIVKFSRYKIKFYSNGGTKVRSITARKGQSFVMPKEPTKVGFIFAGWFEDKALKNRFIATTMSKRRRMKAYAKWVDASPAPFKEEVIEQPAPAPVEEPAPAPAPVAAPVAPEAPASENNAEKLLEFYKEIRKTALGYALNEPNDKAEDGKMVVRAYLKEENVEVYLALEGEEGLEKAEGAIAEDTPALIKVSDEETLGKAKEFIDKAMTALGLEKTGEEVGELKEGLSKGFGYRIKAEK